MAQMKMLTIELIEEGRLLQDVDEALGEIQCGLIEYRKRWGDAAAEKAKGTVTLKLTVCCDDPKNDLYSVKGEVQVSVPKRPARTTVALEDKEQDGTPALFARASGTTEDAPGQKVLCTRDGRTVDPDTGEVIEDED